ncbi:hypothetical protein R5R35_009561 [Gryllus longicercus]|uniref:RING-type domain-containing protein n=1 Tax=Gryllus longicercus TaxID=2509291 RepID=A0AAN9VKJ1_9ORTH
MQITCTICSDLFVAADAVVGTHCGHLFHHACLIQWLERSKSCPQCRSNSNEKNIIRIYFNIHNAGTEDTNTLQNKVGSLEFNLMLKSTELKKLNEEIATFDKKSAGLKSEIKRLKGEVKSSESNMYILKEQFNVLKKRNEYLEPVLTERERLQKEVQFLRNIETVIKGSSEEVDEILNDYGDSSEATKSLLTFTSVLKKEMQTTAAKKKELSTKLREAESKNFSLAGQVRRLEEKLKGQEEQNRNLLLEVNHLVEERASLKKKLDALQQAVISPTASHPCASALKRVLAESPAPDYLKRSCLDDSSIENLAKSPDLPSPPVIKKEAAPYLSIKSSASGLTPMRFNQTVSATMSKYSIFRKGRLDGNTIENTAPPREEEYDGMGGHSKLDEFPQPIPRIKVKNVNKYQRLSKIKLKDASKVLKMDQFLQK